MNEFLKDFKFKIQWFHAVAGVVTLVLTASWLYNGGVMSLFGLARGAEPWVDPGVSYEVSGCNVEKGIYKIFLFSYQCKVTNNTDKTISKIKIYYRVNGTWFDKEIERLLAPGETGTVPIQFQHMDDKRMNKTDQMLAKNNSFPVKIRTTSITAIDPEDPEAAEEVMRFGRIRTIIMVIGALIIEGFLIYIFTRVDLPAVLEVLLFMLLAPVLIPIAGYIGLASRDRSQEEEHLSWKHDKTSKWDQ